MKANPFIKAYHFLKKYPNLKIFLFCFAIIFGPAFALFSEYSYDLVANPDIATYINVATEGFDQSAVRRYRVIVPFLAAAIDFFLGPIFNLLQPWTFPGPNFSLGMSFFLLNSTLMSIFGVLVYRMCKSVGVSSLAGIIGLLSVLTSRWTAYFAGLPLVDSLYCIVIGLALLGIIKKNKRLIIISILLGPWAKESFIFIAPIIFFYSDIPKLKQVFLFGLSGLLVFSFRYYFDVLNGVGAVDSLQKDFAHFDLIVPAVKRFFSFHGVYELVSIFGVWGLLFLGGLDKNIRGRVKEKMPSFTLFYILVIFVHAFLSTDLARMFYLFSPILAVLFALIFDEFYKKYHSISIP